MRRKAQSAAGTATLLILIGGFILLYLLFIDPASREELLGGEAFPNPEGRQPGQPGTGGGYGQPQINIPNGTLLRVAPGVITRARFDNYDHPIASFNLYEETSAGRRVIRDSVSVKASVFESTVEEVPFSLRDVALLSNVYFSFTLDETKTAAGRLKIYLNDNVIFDKEMSSAFANPIPLSVGDLREDNVLRVEVERVGWEFWKTNGFTLTDLAIVFDETDLSNTQGRNTFVIDPEEMANMEKATLKFIPHCDRFSNGPLTVMINGRDVFSAVADCDIINLVDLSPELFESGTNIITFTSSSGQYLIDQININTEMREQNYPRYSFHLDESYFFRRPRPEYDEPVCGEIDGYCPEGCDSDVDKDCCFRTGGNYWCDVEPLDTDDRCSPILNEDDCAACPSGYEDRFGSSPRECRRFCGDDKDGYCPAGCSPQFDEDCCFDISRNNFWCEDAPEGGLNFCKSTLTQDECYHCPTERGWYSERADFYCEPEEFDYEYKLRPSLEIEMTIQFFDDRELKSGTMFVNGNRFTFDTRGREYKRDISELVREEINTIKIEPEVAMLEVLSVDIEIKRD